MPKIGRGTKIWQPLLTNIGDATIGEDCVIHPFVSIYDGVKIGNRVHIEAHAFLPKGVTIEDDVFIGPHVCFTNDKHPPSHGNWSNTLVAKGASVCANATILPDITIGERAVVGAGAVVTKNVRNGETVVGNPARPIDSKKGGSTGGPICT